MNRFIGCLGLALGFAIVPLKVARADDPPRLNIVVVEGEGAINNIKQRTSRETIVPIEVDVFFAQLTPGVFLICELNDAGDGVDFDTCTTESIWDDSEQTYFEWDTGLMD